MIRRLPAASDGAPRSKLLALCALSVFSVLLGACETLPSQAKRSIADQLPPPSEAETSGDPLDIAWWESLGDPALSALVAGAATANHDVRAALANAELARADVMSATARLLPSVSAVANAEKKASGYQGAVRQEIPDIRARQVSGQASWEIDLFGAAREGRRAAQAQALAADEAQRGARLIAISETARQYFEFCGAIERREILEDLLQTERDTLRLTQLRRDRRAASDFDVDRAQAELSDTEAMLPRLDTLVAISRFHLATLTGREPGSWDSLWGAPCEPVDGLGRLLRTPTSQPADLLRRRPDVMAAEAALTSTEHGQARARAAQYPQLFISALFGRQWTTINAVNIGPARFLNLAGAFTLPLLMGGQIRAGIHAADARQAEALARYEQSVLRALEDTEDALTLVGDDARAAAALAQSVRSRESALTKARALYQAGQSDLLQLLDVQRGLLSARLSLSTNRTDRITDSVQLYRAIGGGWQSLESTALLSATHQEAAP